MKLSLIFAVVLAFIALTHAAKLASEDIIASINNNPHSTWEAGHNKFSNWDEADIKKLFGVNIETRPEILDRANAFSRASKEALSIPTEFDSRTNWPGCVHPIRNQAKCGSCWAFGATEVLSDRFCIASGGKVNVVLSPQDMVSCDRLNQGCNGGILGLAWGYLKRSGVVSEECLPYKSQDGTRHSCPDKCVDGSSFKDDKYFVSSYRKVSKTFGRTDPSVIQEEIMKNGPVEAAFQVYEDFMLYKKGVYQRTSSKLLGGHAIKVIGWGVENGVSYWLIANSWGTDWGMEGFFKIKLGSNECGIESDAYAGTPDLDRLPKKN